MPPLHTPWLQGNAIEITTSDRKRVSIVDFNHGEDTVILNAWAKHFREHYIKDADIDAMCTPMGLSRGDYLRQIKFPSVPMIISSDFAEILVADYIEFILNYTVPRVRYDRKLNRNTSPFGVDVLGFKIVNETESPQDELLTCEVKATLSSRNAAKFQEAIDHSKNDFLTKTPDALNAMKQRLLDRGDLELAKTVERFQNKTSRPYKAITSASLVSSEDCWTDDSITTSIADHVNENLFLFVIKGNRLMDLARRLYELAYATA